MLKPHHLLIAIVALVPAACGSTSNTSTTSRAAFANDMLQLSQCMRVHGVPNFPDPSPSGGIRLSPGMGVDPRSPAFQTAQKACAKYAPAGKLGGKPTEADRERAVAFAKCMRSHGEPNFPDPTFGAPPALGKGGGAAIAFNGMVFRLGNAVDPGSPAFNRAMSACGLRPPPGARRSSA